MGSQGQEDRYPNAWEDVPGRWGGVRIARYTVEELIADGDKVVARLTAQGTQQGALMEIPPTGKRVTWSEIHIGRVVNGTIAERWGEIDNLGMLQQLGVIPMPGQGGS
jgi:predicted ester cyclase